MNSYIGLDLGTSSLKATAIDDTGKILATCTKKLDIVTSKSEFAEQDPAIWWTSTKELFTILQKKMI